MKTWGQAFKHAVASGCAASALSTAALALSGKRENGTPYAPTNAISHWIWGETAAHQDGASPQHTLVGYLIHHAAATFWGVVYEKWFGEHGDRKQVFGALTGGAAVATLACFVDYKMTPRRLRPGYEKRLSSGSLFLVYASFGIGLAAAGLLRPRSVTAAAAS